MLETGTAYHGLWKALVERWQETIDNFHTLIREWTLTPFEFSMSMGIHFGSHPLDVDSSLLSPGRLADLLSFALECKKNDSCQRSVLCEQVMGLSRVTKGGSCGPQLHAVPSELRHEAWAYLCFPFNALTLNQEVPWEIPIMSRFRLNLIKKYNQANHQYLKGRFNNLSIIVAWELPHTRVLLRCGVILRYYLSERVYHQLMANTGEMFVAVTHLQTALSEVLTQDDFLKKSHQEAEASRQKKCH
ncbi:hypothetical protein JCGZ_22499 [Jatropha curcas]|uniref:Uncharacterized protein n=1 Tax=Jatropha curcas TaxID=180498 RepID=A0A067JQX5_JATCU|nr:hypothetical protein JCGZ_22499 [Jatropha curcas]